MTRKHFEAIAAILKANKASAELVHEMAGYLATQNVNFNRSRFVRASGRN